MTRLATWMVLLASVMIVGWTDTPAQAQKPPTDFTELSLEELMELDVLSIDVLGTHTHQAGQWMLGYRFMFMSMDGNRDGTKRISDSDVLKRFAVAPTDMTMHMHMPMVMYAPSEDLTLMAMFPYIRMSMTHITRENVRFTGTSEGIGDLQVNALYTFYRYKRWVHRFVFNAGFSFPTGSIDEQAFGADRAKGKARLEYPMQMGSGTFDLLPGIVYFGQTDTWGWKAEVIPTIRLGKNSHGYRLGNRYHLSAGGARKLTDWLSLSAQIDGQIWEHIHGADPALDPEEEPTKDPNIQGGKRIDLLPGVNFYVPKGRLKGHRFAIQGGVPIYQSLNGPQLAVDWKLTVGWQWTFY